MQVPTFFLDTLDLWDYKKIHSKYLHSFDSCHIFFNSETSILHF